MRFEKERPLPSDRGPLHQDSLRWISKLDLLPLPLKVCNTPTEIDDETQLNSARIKQLERERERIIKLLLVS